MLKKLKSNRGVTGVDATIAVVLLIIFVPLITSLFYNIASVKKSSQRKFTAVNIAIQVIEGIKLKNYDSIQPGITINDALGQSGNYNVSNIPNGFEIEIAVTEQDGEEPGKEIGVIVSYLERNKTEKVELKTKILAESQSSDKIIGVSAQVTNTPENGESFVEGETIEYQFSVTNLGTKPLHDIKIFEGVENPYNERTIDVPVELDFNEESPRYEGTFKAKGGDWSSYIKVIATTSDNETIEFTTRLKLCEIVKGDEITVLLIDENGPANGLYYDVGQTVEFTTIVKNTGTTTLKGITITSAKGVEENIIGRLEPGQFRVIGGYTYIIKNEDVGKNTISYNVKVETSEPKISREVTATAKVVPAMPSMDMLFAETSQPKDGAAYNYYTDPSIDFKITLRNTGNTSLKNIKIKLYIGSSTGIDEGIYDYVYGWENDGTDSNKGNIDMAMGEEKVLIKKVLPTDIRLENFTGEKLAFIEVIAEDGTTQRSDYININLSYNIPIAE